MFGLHPLISEMGAKREERLVTVTLGRTISKGELRADRQGLGIIGKARKVLCPGE
jgi:hypothetical protein